MFLIVLYNFERGRINVGLSTQVEKHVHYSGVRSHAGEACAKVQTHVHMSRGMCTSLGTCALHNAHAKKLGENAGLSTQVEKHVHKSRSMCTTLAHAHRPARHAQTFRRMCTCPERCALA